MAEIEVKNQFNYIEYSKTDFTALYSVPVAITKTLTEIYKIHRKAIIGIQENLNIGDVIFMGVFPKRYKIISDEGFVRGKRGRLYRIKRVDNAFITAFDVENTPINSKVKILTRKSYERLRNMSKFSDEL